ncbi:MAG: hypothetical protein IANPNBLG_04146 [Bryobacteraceae bacterium]|nr:hypothetical protein [Bryobacteraceae bacterium]
METRRDQGVDGKFFSEGGQRLLGKAAFVVGEEAPFVIPVNGQHIVESVAVEVGDRAAKAEQAGDRVGQGRGAEAFEYGVALVDQHAEAVGGPNGEVGFAVVVEVGGGAVEEGVGGEVIARAPGFVLELPAAAVQVENGRFVVAKDEDVEAPVVVEVGEDGCAGAAGVFPKTRGIGDAGECAVSIVAV